MLNYIRKLYTLLIASLRQSKIHSRLLITFFIISLVPAISIGLFAYNIYSDSIYSKVKTACLQSIELLNNDMTTQFLNFSTYIGSISVSKAVQEGIAAVNEGADIDVQIVKEIADTINMTPLQNIHLKNIRVVAKNHQIIYDLGYDGISLANFNRLINTIEEDSPYDSLQYVHTYRSSDKIVIGRKIYNLQSTKNALGYIMLYIDEALLSKKLFTDVDFGANSNFLLINNDGNIISSQKAELLGKNLNQESFFQAMKQKALTNDNYLQTKYQGQQYHIAFKYNNLYNVYLAALIPQSYITEDINILNTLLIALTIMLIILSLSITTVVYHSVMQPINNMIYACNTTDEAEIDLKINDKSPDELGFLARTLDNMVHELGILIKRSIADQQRMRELELQSLQYQINPHFLFNTLNTLKWIAKLNHINPVSEGISSLSSLLQATLVNKNEMITLAEEIANLKHYCQIQQLRYAGRFAVSYEINDNLQNRLIPRFILQPLVENSILHGNTDDDDFVTITVKAYVQEDKLNLEIKDTGKGFNLKDIKNKNNEKFSGIGLNNVDERLRLHYGRKNGLIVN